MDTPADTRAPAGSGPRERGGLAEWGLGAVGSLIALLAPLMVLAAPGSEVVAVVGRPGDRTADLAGLVADAGGAILDASASDHVILARADRAGFALRLYAAGARLVLDAGPAGGCGRSASRAIPSNATPIPTESFAR